MKKAATSVKLSRSGGDISPSILRKAVQSASERAVNERFALGLEISIFEDGKLWAVDKNGNRRVIEDDSVG